MDGAVDEGKASSLQMAWWYSLTVLDTHVTGSVMRPITTITSSVICYRSNSAGKNQESILYCVPFEQEYRILSTLPDTHHHPQQTF